MNDMGLYVDGGGNVEVANIFDGLEKKKDLAEKEKCCMCTKLVGTKSGKTYADDNPCI